MIESYHKQLETEKKLHLRELLKLMPPYVSDYFRAKEPTTTVKTRISYANDLNVYFRFLKESNPMLRNKEIRNITLDDLEKVNHKDIEEFLEYLNVYDDEKGKQVTNSNAGRARKLSALRSFYTYFYVNKDISTNAPLQVPMPKIQEKSIIRLEPQEVARLLDYVEARGAGLKGMKLYYYEKNKVRDFAILTLLLSTGIRVSECIGLNMDDVDLENDYILVIRKGGNQETIYLSEEAHDALEKYMYEVRVNIKVEPGHENALFLSIQRKRIGIKAVENMVKDYTQHVTKRKITPHRLRATCATTLYNQTEDIALVAAQLGHKDISITRKFYAHLDEKRRKEASRNITLREME